VWAGRLKGLGKGMKKSVAKASKAAADATGVQALAIEVKLEYNHTGEQKQGWWDYRHACYSLPICACLCVCARACVH